MSLGVLGGTFDPIHFAHLRLGEEAREALGLRRVLFVPAAQPALKSGEVAPAADRLEMARLATATNPAFEVLDLEIARGGTSYTVDTLRALRERYPDERLWFIVGADALRDLERWREPVALVELASFAVAARRGSPVEPGALLPDSLAAHFRSGPTGPVHPSGNEIRAIPFPALEISATEIRRRVARGASIRYQVPEAVLDYIHTHGIYGEVRRP